MGRNLKMKISILVVGAFSSQSNGENIAPMDAACDRIGGSCLNWDYYLCTAGWETGLCSGPNNIKCCNECNQACVNQENRYNDKSCSDKGGKCQHNSNKCSSGGYQGGLCGGPADREGCGASGSNGDPSTCTLINYSSSRIKGYNGKKIRVDEGFKSEMDKMDGFARQCSVTVYVGNSFPCGEGQNIGGTVVPPASNSNHSVGHAIDFNLDTPSGWCNGDCLDWETNSYAKCFTDKLDADRVLVWGAQFNDPAHVDDNLNKRDPAEFNRLSQANGSCPKQCR